MKAETQRIKLENEKSELKMIWMRRDLQDI